MKRLGLLVLLVLGVLGMVWAALSVMHEGYQIEQLHAKRQTLLRATKDLEIEVARLSALDRIERIATQELGLMIPRDNQVILVRQTPLKQR